VAELVLAGDLTRPATLTVPDLLGRPQHQAEVTFECATSGVRHHRFTGPLLHEILVDAGSGFDPVRRRTVCAS
jgi:DMSO/TMAO reductase YedYZ molybdopterin-dependent catalytic subunit